MWTVKKSEFGRRLEALTVRVTSPDGHILASVKGRGSPVVSFDSPESIERYRSADDLARQVNTTLGRAMLARSDGRKYIVEKFSRLVVRSEANDDEEASEFQLKCSDLVGYGFSPSELIDVATIGLRDWEVDIDADLFLRIESAELCAELNAAIRQASSSYAAKVRDLRNTMFD